MRILYNILAYLAIPIILIRLFIRSRQLKAYREHIGERFGFVPKASTPCLWFHAVSVGESIAAVPLVERCLEAYPDLRIVVTNTTPTGRERTRALLKDRVENYYFPYDLPDVLKRFIGRQQPKMLVLMETELWPNLLHYTKHFQIKSLLANARLSERSASNYAGVHSLTKSMFKNIDYVAVQADADKARFITLGVDENKIQTVGSVKYDLSVPESIIHDAQLLREQIGLDRPVWIASSTHEGEEEQVLEAHRLILDQHPKAVLVLVPRHPNRFNDIAESLAKQQWSFVRRSGEFDFKDEAQVLLGDTMGEMMLFYALSDVVFVAGSFKPIGGHNTMEPAVLAKPILQGPRWHNFAEATRLLTAAEAIIEVADAKALAEKVSWLFQEKDAATTLGHNAKSVVDANRGSGKRQFEILQGMLSAK